MKDFIAHIREKDGVKQGLWEHLEETATLAGCFASKIGLGKYGFIMGLLHDLGKATVQFDQYIRSASGLIESDEDDYVNAKGLKGKIDHSSAGAKVIYDYLSRKGNRGLIAAQLLSLSIYSHHSGLIDCLTIDGEDNFSRRFKKSEEKTRTEEAFVNLDCETKKILDDILNDDTLLDAFNSKLISFKSTNSDINMFYFGLLEKFLFSCLIDADRLSTADFEYPDNIDLRNYSLKTDWSELISRFDSYIGRLKRRNFVDDIRNQISIDCLNFSVKPKGLYLLTVPTGGGKTLSSLRFALNHSEMNNMDRIIYIIPYTSIIDQNAQIAKDIFEKEEPKDSGRIILEHHSNLTPDEESTRQRLLSQNWDAPIVFTTMVQFLEAFYGYGTRSIRRIHQLANAVIIFDEIQTLPIKCVHIFNITIRFLIDVCGATVVLCTATQPLLNRIDPVHRALNIGPEQEIVQDVNGLFKKLKRVEVTNACKIGGWTDNEIAELALTQLRETGSVLVVVNTKKSAISLYLKLKETNCADVFHLSTNMCPAHRMKILESVKKNLELSNNKPTICVSTQLIEAGVDIDFASVIRFLAGLDSIAQAAGRCNRNGLANNPGKVFVINPSQENLDKLEDIIVGRQITERIFGEYEKNSNSFDNDILSPKAMELYYKYYFYKRSEKMNYPISRSSSIGREDNLFELLSMNGQSVAAFKNNTPIALQMPLRQSFMSASKVFKSIDTATRGIVVPYTIDGKQIIQELCSVKDPSIQLRLVKKAQRYSVNVFQYIFESYLKNQVIIETQEGSGIFYLDEHFYSNEFGMSEMQIKKMDFLNY